MTLSIDTSQVKARFSEIAGRVAHRRERLVVLRRGKPFMALVPLEDLHRLESLDVADETEGPARFEHPIMKAYGLWADSPEMDEIMEEIIRERHNTPPVDTHIWD